MATLRPGSNVISHPVQGQLREATANDQAISGSVTPIVRNLNARARSGQTYRVLFGVATPQGDPGFACSRQAVTRHGSARR